MSIEGPGSAISIEASFPFTDPGVCFVDEVLGSIATRVQVNNPVNTFRAGTYTIRYTALDTYSGADPSTLTFAQYDQQRRFAKPACAGSDICTRAVNVQDTLKPVISLNYGEANCGALHTQIDCTQRSFACRWKGTCVAVEKKSTYHTASRSLHIPLGNPSFAISSADDTATLDEPALSFNTAKGSSILVHDGCTANTDDDQVEYVQLISSTGTTLTGVTGYKPVHSGSWTMDNGVSIQCWHYTAEDSKWDSTPILDKQDAGIGYSYGTGKGPSRTHSFTFTPQRLEMKTHFVRCGIVDRSSSSCKFDVGLHCATGDAGSLTGHHFDNADVTFTSVDRTLTNPAKLVTHSGSRVFKTFDTVHELGTAVWIEGVPHFDTSKECKEYCATIPACNYGTYITAGSARAGECWLAAQTSRSSTLRRCGVPCESFFDSRAVVPEIERIHTTKHGREHRRLRGQP
jgi:hypothetical protein